MYVVKSTLNNQHYKALMSDAIFTVYEVSGRWNKNISVDYFGFIEDLLISGLGSGTNHGEGSSWIGL